MPWMIDPNKPVGLPPETVVPPSAKPATDTAAVSRTPNPLGATDSVGMTAKSPAKATPNLMLVGDADPAKGPAAALATGKPADEATPHPWKLKSMNIRYGLIFNNQYAKSDMHVTDPVNGTDMTIHKVGAHQRLSAQYLYSMPNGFPQPDEPQSEIGISGKFQNDWGFEANLKHHKYVVMTGEDPDQMVRMSGTLNGAPIDETRSLKGYLPEYQVTDGLNQITLMATRSFDLPHPKKDAFTYNIKAGPSVMMPYVKSTVVNADGTTSSNHGPYQFGGGFGGQIEQSLRYDFRNRVSVELTEGGSVMTVNNGAMPNGGKVKQTVWAHSMALTLGYTIGKNWGKHKH
jgi:hypothetical protein